MNELNQKTETAKVSAAHPLLRRLGRAVDLTPGDLESLMRLQRNRIKVDAGSDLLRSGQDLNAIYVVQSGWLVIHCLFDDGRRQIFAVLLPGDVIGEFAPYQARATYNVTAVTDAEVAALNSNSFLGLRSQSATLAAALGSSSARDSVILGDQILRLGRLTSYERHCHLMLELWHRMNMIDGIEDGWMQWPLKQMDIADILGLSLVHVNRTMMQLKRDGLIALEKRRLKILDLDRMMTVAQYDPARLMQRAA